MHGIGKISDLVILAVYLVNFVEHLRGNGKSWEEFSLAQKVLHIGGYEDPNLTSM